MTLITWPGGDISGLASKGVAAASPHEIRPAQGAPLDVLISAIHLSFPDRGAFEDEILMTNYLPKDPADTQAFEIALRDHRTILWELLTCADALQDAVFEALKASDADGVEIGLTELEIALGCGTEAAIIVAKMSGLMQAGDGRWYSCLEGACIQLHIPQNFLAKHLRSVAKAV